MSNLIRNPNDAFALIIAIGLTIYGNAFLVKGCQEDMEQQDREIKEMLSKPITSPHYTETNYKPKPTVYQYRITIEDDPNEYQEYEVEPSASGRIKLRKHSNDYEYLNGTWEWETEEYLPTLKEQYEYVKRNYHHLNRVPK